MLVLKRLADAERDGDRIYAVIRGIGSSSDGRSKAIYAPRARTGRRVALRPRVRRTPACSPATIELVEAHGTGTTVGDATELERPDRRVSATARRPPVRGRSASVKSQIGHTKAAAGAAGLIKAGARAAPQGAAAHDQGRRAQPRPSSSATPPFYVNTEARPWMPRPASTPRRAAVVSASASAAPTSTWCSKSTATAKTCASATRSRPCTCGTPRTPPPSSRPSPPVRPRPDGPAPEGHARVAAGRPHRGRADDAARAGRSANCAPARGGGLVAPQGRPLPHDAPHRPARSRRSSPVRAASTSTSARAPSWRCRRCAPPSTGPTCTSRAREPLSRVAFPPPLFGDGVRTAQETALQATAYAQPAIGALSAGQFRYLYRTRLRRRGVPRPQLR